MATFYFTKLAVPSEENSFHPEILCHACGLHSIPRPKGATAATRYACPSCCDLLLKSRNKETANMFAVISAQIDRAYMREPIFVGHVNANSE